MDINGLIEKISSEAKPVKPLLSPIEIFAQWLLLSAAYITAALLFMGLRKDLSAELSSPLFLTEIFLLFLLITSSMLGTIFTSFPDLYQRPKMIYAPFIVLAAFIIFLTYDYLTSVTPESDPHQQGIECFLCISALSLLPSIMIFIYLLRQASTNLFLSGLLAMLSSASLGCFVLKLVEETNSLPHLIVWHYMPMAGFALLGLALGKKLLKW